MSTENKDFTLLLVDDNQTNLSLLAQIVEMDLPQVQVHTALSAVEGLELVAEYGMDGAFVDVQMPGMSGIEMCRQLKENPHTRQIPVVLMTAHIATADLRAEGLEAGAYDFISQPISNVEMLARIKVMLRLRQSEKQLLATNEILRQQVESKTSALRWLSGLLLAGGDELTEEDRQLAVRLEERIPEDRLISAEHLSGQLFKEMPLRWQRTVLKLSLLEEMPRSLAEQLAEIDDVEGALDYLWRHNFFVDQRVGKEVIYIFHNDLREGLKSQVAGLLSDQEQEDVCSLAADWYRQQGQLVTALGYLLTRNLFSEAELFLSQQGIDLVYAGCQQNFIDLLDEIPEEVAVKRCWLALFVGIGKLQSQPREADEWLELARTHFELRGERRGELLALSHQVHLYLIVDGLFKLGEEIKPRIQQLLDQNSEELDPVSKALGFGFLALIQTFMGNDLKQAERNVREGLHFAVSSELAELQFLLRQFCTFLALVRGRFRLAFAEQEISQMLGRGMSETAPARLTQKVLLADLLLATGNFHLFREYLLYVEQVLGRGLLQQTGLGAVFCRFRIESLLAEGEKAEARDSLEICMTKGLTPSNAHMRSMLLQFRALLWFAEPAQQEAVLLDLQESLQLRKKTGGLRYILINWIIAATCFTEQKDFPRAEKMLQQALDLSTNQGELLLRGGIYARQADLYLSQGCEAKALESLCRLLTLLEDQGLDSFYLLTPDILQRLLPLAVKHQVLPEIALRLASRQLRCHIRNDGRLLPLLIVKTLGPSGFFIAGGKILECSDLGSIARQIVDLLVIAPNHKLGLEYLLGVIWPESSTNRARASFDTNLSRLRKILDSVLVDGSSRDYLVLEKGVLSLQNTLVDCRLFGEAVSKAQQHLRRQEPWQAGLAFQEADRFWNGEFLVGLDLIDELVQEQQRLTEMRLDMLETWSGLLLEGDDNKGVEGLLQEGLRLDPIRERLVSKCYRYYLSRREVVQAKKELDNYFRALLVADYPEEDAREIVAALEQKEKNLLLDQENSGRT